MKAKKPEMMRVVLKSGVQFDMERQRIFFVDTPDPATIRPVKGVFFEHQGPWGFELGTVVEIFALD